MDLEFYFDFASMISVGISLPSQPTDFSKFDTIFDKSLAKNFLFVSLANIFRLVVLRFFLVLAIRLSSNNKTFKNVEYILEILFRVAYLGIICNVKGLNNTNNGNQLNTNSFYGKIVTLTAFASVFLNLIFAMDPLF